MGFQCFNCNSTSVILYKKIDNYSIYQCSVCKLLLTDNDKSLRNSINKKTYSQNYINDYLKYRKKDLIRSFKGDLVDIEKRKFGGNILDIGCGPGLLLYVFKKYSKYPWKLFGIDINVKSINVAHKIINANYKVMPVNKIDYVDNFFDCICCYDILEHLISIDDSLNQIKRVLKPDGLLVIQVPNYLSLMQMLSKEDWDWWCVPDHVLHFNIYTIKTILEQHGFKIVKLRTRNSANIFVKNVQGHLKRRITQKMYLNKIIAKLSIIPLYLIWAINSLLGKYNYLGGLIYVLAQKQ